VTENERRTTDRLHFIAPCIIKIEGFEEEYQGEIHNLSQHGAFIKPKRRLPDNIAGRDAMLIIYDQDFHSIPRIKAEGKIVHEDKSGIGFYMRSMNSQSFGQLKILLAKGRGASRR